MEMEVRLREVLVKVPEWPPSRLRAQAAIDALVECAQMLPMYKAVLPLAIEEVEAAIFVPPRKGIVDGVATYFELCESLKQDIDQLMGGAQRARAHIQSHSESLKKRNELVLDAQRRLAECEAMLEERNATISALKKEIEEKYKKSIALFDEEVEAFQRRLGLAEELRRSSEERMNEVRVQLFVEQKKVLEQAQLFKEHRDQSRVRATVAQNELRDWQRMLLRAQHASLRAEGRGAQCMELIELPIKEQLERAMRWAEDFPEVKSEGSLEHTPVKGPMAHEKPKRRADKVMVDSPDRKHTSDSSARKAEESAAAVERAADVANRVQEQQKQMATSAAAEQEGAPVGPPEDAEHTEGQAAEPEDAAEMVLRDQVKQEEATASEAVQYEAAHGQQEAVGTEQDTEPVLDMHPGQAE